MSQYTSILAPTYSSKQQLEDSLKSVFESTLVKMVTASEQWTETLQCAESGKYVQYTGANTANIQCAHRHQTLCCIQADFPHRFNTG